jgi:hypothetical protein
MDDLTELQNKLQQQQQSRQPSYRIRTAKIDAVAQLLKVGYTPLEISLDPTIDLPLATIKAEKLRMEERNRAIKKLTLNHGMPDDEGGYVAICPK